MSSKIKISLAWQMMIGLALGIVVGALVDSSFAQTWLQPLGDLFIRLIRMVVVPLVLATIIAGAAASPTRPSSVVSPSRCFSSMP